MADRSARFKGSRAIRERIVAKIEAHAAGAAGRAKALRGREGLRLRIGDFRVVYTVEDDVLTVRAVGDRKDVYD